MYRPYQEVKPLLGGYSRKEQYNILLNTTEWQDFREKNIAEDHRTCKECNLKEGFNEFEIMTEDECQKLNSEINEYNEALRKKMKQTSIEEFFEQLLNRTYEGLRPNEERFGAKKVILQIHHKLYYWNRLPWEYTRQDLLTLCHECHMKVHSEHTIFMYKDETKTLKVQAAGCSKCGGTGYLKEYNYYMNGVCFECGGSGNSISEEPKWSL